MQPQLPASDAVALVTRLFAGCEGWLGGGALLAAVAAEQMGDQFEFAYDDIDVFVATSFELGFQAARLETMGAGLDRKTQRALTRWRRRGMGGWETNSLKADLVQGVTVNLVYKTVDRSPLRTGAAMVETFDHGHLAQYVNLRSGTFHSLRQALFPDQDPDDPDYPMFEVRGEDTREGWISKYLGPRAAWRWAKSSARGYPMSKVGVDLVQGYQIAGLHYQDSDDPDDQLRAQLYSALGAAIEAGDADQILTMYSTNNLDDPFDKILRSLDG